MLLQPNRAGVPIYGQPRATVVFMAPPAAVRPLPPPPPGPRPPVPPIARYYNTDQTCVSTCPEGTIGDPIIVTVGAGSVSSTVSVAAANAQAMSDACAEADRLRGLTPCEEAPDIELSLAFRAKEGEAACTPDAFTAIHLPVSYNGIGTAAGCCGGTPELCAIASATCDPVSISADDSTINYRLTAFSIIRPMYNIGCGVSNDVNVTAYPANGAIPTDVGSGVGGIALYRLPAYNPYTFVLSVKFDLVGTRVAAPDSAIIIDVSKVQFVGCRMVAEDAISDGNPWVTVTQEEALSFFTPDVDNENVAYKVAQVQIAVVGLTPGQGYKVTIILVSRPTGSGDPFTPNGRVITHYFAAVGTSYTSSWINIPLEDGQDTGTDNSSVAESYMASAEISSNGQQMTIGFSGNATFGGGGSGGFSLLLADGTVVDLTYVSGAGTDEVIFNLSQTIYALDGDAILSYTNPGSGLSVGGIAASSFDDYTVSNTSDAIPAPDISWIKFDEGSGTSFAGTIGSGGTLSSAAMWTAGPVGGFAIQGNGSTRFGSTTSSLIFNSASVVTVFFRCLIPSSSPNGMLIEGSANFETNSTFAIYVDSGNLGCNMCSGVVGAQFNVVAVAITKDVWHDVMFVMDRDRLTIQTYIDGVLTTPISSATNIDLHTTNGDFQFYFLSRGGASLFSSSKLDDVRMWTGDLSQYVDLIDADT